MHQETIDIKVTFFSYFKDLTGCPSAVIEVNVASTLEQAIESIHQRFPNLKPMKRSTLTAVGLEYVAPDYILQLGDEISLFPPVQGG